MGSIRFSLRDYFDNIIEIVGIKSGILLTIDDVREMLKGAVDQEILTQSDLNLHLRIRSDEFEEHVSIVRIAIGNLPKDRLRPRLMAPELMKWIKLGFDPLKTIDLMIEISATVPGGRAEPRKVIEYVQSKLAVPEEMIIDLAIQMGERDFESAWVSPVEAERWDGGIPLENLFECEIKDDDKQYIDQSFLDYLAANPDKLQSMHWRNFERFCAEFFARNGYSVNLGPGRNDGGIDLRVHDNLHPDRPLIVIQCKRYKEDNHVSIETVKAFYTDVQFEKALKGLIVTTSRIERGGKRTTYARKYNLDFAELEQVKKWSKSMWRYGTEDSSL